ncbi:hypothetical protein [Nostoc sp.]
MAQAHAKSAMAYPPAVGDRTLAKLKMGRQSPAGKAIQAFIKELTRG